MSGPEPELGLGVVRGVAKGKVKLWFPAASETRIYAWPGAPLVRVKYGAGEVVSWDGGAGPVQWAEERDGVMHYQIGGVEISEAVISGRMGRRGPLDRVAAGSFDGNAAFELRREALFRRARLQRSAARGLTGARMELIPHQLGIASEVSGRLLPRVLLADEVGLGKTIEACLILHRLHLTGRASRVLILLPEPLIHQWFVELLRRFNLRFSLFDEERCGAIEDGPEGGEINPFLDSQLVICPLSLLADDTRRGRQAVKAGWDLVIVDEAHRLSGGAADGEGGYAVVEALAGAVPGLLLLSGTPQQAGEDGHFARLRLLDPARYADYGQFCRGMEECGRLAEEIGALKNEGDPDRIDVVRNLLDRRGIGRVMFRNVRSALGGFPERRLHRGRLPDAEESTRVKWLATLLRSAPDEKFLLICKERERAEALKELLAAELEVKTGVFHEGLTLLQRDRQAAWFSEEDGARILLCSEIGSEGRNFQFARHLVLWDLPEDPELLEQRIGRLDRIGQRGTIHLHVPHADGTAEEVLLRWYADGLGAFAGPVSGVSRMARETGALLRRAMAAPTEEKIAELVDETISVRKSITENLAHGYDRLLQWQTGAALTTAATMRELIEEADADRAQEAFWIRLLEGLGMQVEELRPRRWAFQAGSPETESLPEMPVEGFTGTFDRKDALEREDIGFLTNDHPLLRGAMDLLLGGDHGSAACGVLNAGAGGGEGLFLEICFVLECIAPAELNAGRFLPSLPLRVVVDHRRTDCSADTALLHATAADADHATSRSAKAAVLQLDLAKTASALAEVSRTKAIAAALKKLHRILGAEIDRMQALARKSVDPDTSESGNVSLDSSEITALCSQKHSLVEVIEQSVMRMDSVRLLIRRAV
ncbi:MAG: polymerase associated protein RapA [Verrucomicrobiales bacterium]|nr:polymerase associated protein RapA [Verrucomicrobiales bacterium]